MWTSIIMQKNNFVVFGVAVGAFFLVYSAQSHQLCSVESPINSFVRFEQLMIYDTKLIPPNTQYELFLMNVRLGQVVPKILKHGQVVPKIFSSLGYRSESIFITSTITSI